MNYRVPHFARDYRKTISPIIELRSVVRIRVRPALAKLRAQFLLHAGQLPPVMPCVHLLRHADERSRLARANVHITLKDLGQTAAKVVTTMPEIKLCIHVDHVVFAQLHLAVSFALSLKLMEPGFMGACLGGVRKGAASCGALMFFRHFSYSQWRQGTF